MTSLELCVTSGNGKLKERAINVLGLTESEYEELVGAVGPCSLNEFVSILDDFIIREQIPVVIRRRGDGWLKGRTILEVFKTEGIESIRRYIDRLRSYVPE